MISGRNPARRDPLPTAIEVVREAAIAAWRSAGRSAILDRYGVLADEAGSAFDRTVALAAELFDAPVAVISAINRERLWCEGGTERRSARVPADLALFASAVVQQGATVVPDARRDPRFAGDRDADGSPGLRFFVGARLETYDGLVFGALCVAAEEPRAMGITARRERALKLLAEQAMAQLDLRDAANESAQCAGELMRLSLCESEAHYRHTVEHLPQATWTADAEGNLLTISPRWSEWTGLATEAALRQGYLSVVHPDDLGAARDLLARSIRTGATLDMRVRLRNADGTYRWTRAHGVPRRGADGAILRWYGSTEDIDEQVETQRQLAEAEERYRLAVRATRDGIWDWDLMTDEVVHDSAKVAVFGDTAADLPRTSERWKCCIHPDDRARVVGSIEAAIQGTSDYWSDEYRHQIANGSYAFVHDRAFIVRDPQGLAVRMVGATSDVTERRLIEQDLRESEENYRYTIELSPQIPWTSDPDGNVLEIGPRWLALMGMDCAATLGQGWTAALHPEDVGSTRAQWSRSLRTGDPADFRHRLKQRDGSYRWFRVRAAARRGAGGEILRWYGVGEDIHEQVLGDEALRQLQTQLIHFSRVSAMGTMASALAHELNQPLTAAANLLSASQQLLSQRAMSDPMIVELLGKAAEQTLRVGDIIRRLRKLVANGRTSIEAIALRPVVDEAIFLARMSNLSGATYVVAIPDAVPQVLADAVQIQQVLINLIRNATEAMAASAVQQITIAAGVCSEGVEVSVTDTGPGIPAAMRDRLFTAFDSGKVEGLGVGLSISRTIVEAHGGRIWLAEPSGEGARLCFTLPTAGRA